VTFFKHWRADIADFRREQYPAGYETWVDELAMALTGLVALAMVVAIRLVGGEAALAEARPPRDTPVAQPVTE
jgi:hypothetical protein